MAIPPGFTVSVPLSDTRLLEVTLIVTLCPAASEPEAGDADTCPRRLAPDVIV
jgi:hypothetical protein